MKLNMTKTYPNIESESITWGLWYTLKSNQMENIVDTLFPNHHEMARDSNAETLDIPLFSEHEVMTADKDFRRSTCLSAATPRNSCLSEDVFHRTWKVHRLVLISNCKGGLNTPSAWERNETYLWPIIRSYLRNSILICGSADGRLINRSLHEQRKDRSWVLNLWRMSYGEILHIKLPQDAYLTVTLGYAEGTRPSRGLGDFAMTKHGVSLTTKETNNPNRGSD